jgi:hypothetical protein
MSSDNLVCVSPISRQCLPNKTGELQPDQNQQRVRLFSCTAQRWLGRLAYNELRDSLFFAELCSEVTQALSISTATDRCNKLMDRIN